MLVLLSPAKKLNDKIEFFSELSKKPCFINESKILLDRLKKLKIEDFSSLMGVSEKIAELNYGRYQSLDFNDYEREALPSAFAFAGEVYNGLDIGSFSEEELERANDGIRILSGFYGILQPLDLMRAYRLEMGTKLENSRGKNLYEFWGNRVLNYINEIEDECLINLASAEYFKVVKEKKIEADIITPIFKENKNGSYKVVMMYAKKARGMMARYIVKNKIKNWKSLKLFDIEGYKFSEELSSLDGKNKILTFIR